MLSYYYRLTLLGFLTKPYPPGVREGLATLSAQSRGEEGERGGVDDVCRYNFLVGHLFAEAAKDVVTQAGRSMNDITVIGSHG